MLLETIEDLRPKANQDCQEVGGVLLEQNLVQTHQVLVELALIHLPGYSE